MRLPVTAGIADSGAKELVRDGIEAVFDVAPGPNLARLEGAGGPMFPVLLDVCTSPFDDPGTGGVGFCIPRKEDGRTLGALTPPSPLTLGVLLLKDR